jgi:hypothetical protein
MFLRARRQALIRTRLDTETVLTRVKEMVESPAPEGTGIVFAHGYPVGGTVGKDEFLFDYHFDSRKNPQTFEVRGMVDDASEWRVLRIDLRAHDPWMNGWSVLAMAAFAVFIVVTDDVPVGGALALVGFVLAVHAAANLFYIPETVATRVTRELAARVHGSVFTRGDWVVPPRP